MVQLAPVSVRGWKVDFIDLFMWQFKLNQMLHSSVFMFSGQAAFCCYLHNIFHCTVKRKVPFNPPGFSLGFVLFCKSATSSEPQEPLAQSWRILTLLKPNTVLHLVLSQPPLLPWFTLGRWLGFGFITFEAEQSVDQAVNMHFHDIMGKKVCSCSFILPLRSNRGLGDSQNYHMMLLFYT